MHVGIPSDINFVVTRAMQLIGGGYYLTADGYGNARDYGNGALTVWIDDIRPAFARRLKAAAKSAEKGERDNDTQ